MNLRVASFNLCNLSQLSGERRFQTVAETIAKRLSSPPIIALQEVAFVATPTTGENLSAAATYERLIAAIQSMDGPRYEPIEVPTPAGSEGGALCQNIRVGYLIDPERVTHRPKGALNANQAVGARLVRGRLELSASPGRLFPDEAAFRGEAGEGWRPSRRVLAVELRVGIEKLILLNCHFKSMRAETGRSANRAKQQRQAQARLVGAFVAELINLEGSAKILVLGDLNDTPGSKTLQLLKAAGLRNLLEEVPKRLRYSRRHGGRPQLLDHLLVSPALVIGSRGTVVHGNADALPEHRGSDHNPVLAELLLD